MILSALASIFATAVAAAAAYKQIEPIVALVPSINKSIGNLVGDLQGGWKDFTTPEIMKRIETEKKFLNDNRELVEWILHKLAVRLAVGWGILALSTVSILLLIGDLLQTKTEALIAVIVLGLFALVAAVFLWTNRDVLNFKGKGYDDQLDRMSQQLAEQFKRMKQVGQVMIDDLTSASRIVTSLSAISDPERLFIAEYGAIIERQSKFKVGLAIRELKRLKSEPDGLMKDAERYYNAGKNYDLAIFNYEEVLDLLRHEERSFSDPRWSEAYVHYWLGICYANTKHEDDAITQLKEAVSRDKGYAAKICNERFKTLVGPIKDKPALQELIKELQKENQKENQNEQVPDESAMEKDKPGPKKPIVDLRLLRAFEQIEKETIKDH